MSHKNFKISENFTKVNFSKGQVVKLFSPKRLEDESAKLCQPYFGPYYIEDSKLDGRVYYLKDKDGNLFPNPVSVTRIAPWHERSQLMSKLMTPGELESEYTMVDEDPLEQPETETQGLVKDLLRR